MDKNQYFVCCRVLFFQMLIPGLGQCITFKPLRVLQRAQQELDSKDGENFFLEESDIKSMMSVPCEALEDCTISGYYVLKGT